MWLTIDGKKGSARWAPMIFLGKTENDMFIVGLDKSLRITRSIKRIFTDMQAHLGTYQTFNVMSWMIRGTLGTRLRPGMPRIPAAQTGLTLEDDIPASDVEAQAVRGYQDLDSGSEVGGIEVTGEGLPMMLPEVPLTSSIPNPSATATAPAISVQMDTSSHQPSPDATEVVPNVAQQEVAEPGSEMADIGSAVPVTPVETPEEPAAKRARVSISRVAGEEMVHVDETSIFEQSYLNFDVYDDFDMRATTDEHYIDGYHKNFEYEEGGNIIPHDEEHLLWYPISQDEPMVDDETLQHLDDIADVIEIARLKGVHVLEHEDENTDASSLGSNLTAKFVRTWRKKLRDDTEMWLRRSRLVAREFNRLELRDDLFSPASNHVIEKLIPALAVSGVFNDKFVIRYGVIRHWRRILAGASVESKTSEDS